MLTNYLIHHGRPILWLSVFFIARLGEASAQLDSPYTYLNEAEIHTGYFYPQAFHLEDVPNGTSYSQLTPAQFKQLTMQVKKAQTQGNIPELAELRRAVQTFVEEDNAIAIVAFDLNVQDFREDAFIDGSLLFENGYLYDITNNFVSPYEEKKMFFAGLHEEELVGMDHQFVMDPSCYFSNMVLPESIQVDFDDGIGFRSMNWSQIYTVHYSVVDEEKWIRFRSTRNGLESYSGMKLLVRAGGGGILQPHLPPLEWISESCFDDPNFPWQFGVTVENKWVQGNAYTLWSDDGIFDKPFIFVEGIDFANHRLPDRNGEFGWFEFSSGLSDEYDFLEHMPVLINELRANNYDIILLEFRKGDDWIAYNSMLLIKLIDLVNAHKVGKESNVVAGASMGGQITRYALRYMELNEMKHCTRLWISLDSPHTGAYIPLSLQESIKWLAQYNAGAEYFIDEYLLEPATRQMLAVQAFEMDIHEAYYNEINAMGYPQNMRKVAIANGNGFGNGMGYYPGQPMLQYDCDLSYTNPILRFHLHTLPGEEWTLPVPPYTTHYKIAELTYSEKNNGLLEFLQEGSIVQHNKKIFNTDFLNIPNFDLAPGGTRTSLQDFVNSINGGLPSECGQISNYLSFHNFIPSTSAIGLWGVDPTVNASEYMSDNPGSCPFDRTYLAPGTSNQRHSELTIAELGNIPFTLEEVLNGENHIGSDLSNESPLGALFNYGALGDFILPDLHVHQGGQLYMNGFPGLVHFDEEGPLLAHLVMQTSECSSYVLVDNGGYFGMGYSDASATAELIIGDMGVLEMGEGGILELHPQSTIRIKTGGELRLSGGELRLWGAASIIVEEGARIIVDENTDLTPINGFSTLTLGGHIVFESNYCNLELIESNSSGIVLALNSANDQFLGNWSNKVIIQGNDPNHVSIIVPEGKWLRPFWGLGELEIINTTIELDGELHGICKSDFDGVSFIGGGDLKIEAYNDLDNCAFEGVDLKAIFTSNMMLHIDDCSFASGSQVHTSGGGYKLRDCVFEIGEGQPCIGSHHLTLGSSVQNSVFVDVNEGIFDDSNVDLTLKGCSFNSNLIAVQKIGGRLNLRCNEFNNSDWWAVVAGEYCWLNMSANHAAGYNHFLDNEVNILLENASAIDLKRGYNTLSAFYDMNIIGDIAGRYCQTGSSSAVYLDATRNAWSYAPIPVQPSAAFINIETANECEVLLITSDPVVNASCGEQDSGGIVPVKSLATSIEVNKQIDEVFLKTEDPGNPLIFSSHFIGVELQEALGEAASYCTTWNEAGDDEVAVDLFYQILSNDLDRTNADIRWRMKWGQRYMKISLENLFSSGFESSIQNQTSFSSNVDRYVQILNVMTDLNVADSTYSDQFYLEMDKAQLFRLIGKHNICLELLQRTDDCQLDSLEQAHLNFWISRLQEETALIADMSDFVQNQLTYEIDSTLFENAIEYLTDQYYFGAHIFSPSDITYALCESWDIKSDDGNNNLCEISPNPATDFIRIAQCDELEWVRWEIYDVHGRILKWGALNNGHLISVEGINRGIVWLKIYSETGFEVHKVVLG